MMATVLDFAVLIFVLGFLSLFTDRDLIEEPDVGALVGPAMTVTACAVVFALVYRRSPGGVGARALAAALSAAVGAPLVGAVVLSISREEFAVIPVFFGRYILSPFVLTSALVGAAIVAAAALVERRT